MNPKYHYLLLLTLALLSPKLTETANISRSISYNQKYLIGGTIYLTTSNFKASPTWNPLTYPVTLAHSFPKASKYNYLLTMSGISIGAKDNRMQMRGTTDAKRTTSFNLVLTSDMPEKITYLCYRYILLTDKYYEE